MQVKEHIIDIYDEPTALGSVFELTLHRKKPCYSMPKYGASSSKVRLVNRIGSISTTSFSKYLKAPENFLSGRGHRNKIK